MNKIAVIGLGYVGLPLALEFAKHFKVIGFDINQKRVDMMRNNIDPSEELEAAAFEGCDIHFTADLNDLKEGEWFYNVGDHTEKGTYIDGLKTGTWEYIYGNGQIR